MICIVYKCRKLLINEKNVDDYRNINVSFVFLQYNLIEEFTIKENFQIVFNLCKKEMNNDELYKILTLVSLPENEVNLNDFLLRYPDQLSSRQRQISIDIKIRN